MEPRHEPEILGRQSTAIMEALVGVGVKPEMLFELLRPENRGRLLQIGALLNIGAMPTLGGEHASAIAKWIVRQGETVVLVFPYGGATAVNGQLSICKRTLDVCLFQFRWMSDDRAEVVKALYDDFSTEADLHCPWNQFMLVITRKPIKS